MKTYQEMCDKLEILKEQKRVAKELLIEMQCPTQTYALQMRKINGQIELLKWCMGTQDSM